jgi:AraC-like DNA-binding protein
MEEATSFIIENLENPNYRITNLSQDLAYSQRQLERIIKKMTGLSPVAYVREIRLQEAYRLLKSGVYQTISEVRFEVGIEHPSYFKRKFIERFGVSPVEVKGRF